MRRRDVIRVADISYGDAGRQNLLDVYHQRSRPSGGPVLVYLHGGAFRSGRKNREARPLLYRLASQGWVCISANYRLSPAATFPDHLIDVKKVIAWAREHGHEYGADTGVLFTAGSSAGGHLASMAALTPNDPRFQPGFEREDTSVTAAIALYGYFGSLSSRDDLPSSLLAYVERDAPPFFVARRPRHGGDRRGRAPVRRAPAKRVVTAGGLRGAPRRAARVRRLPLPPVRAGGRRDRGVHGLGAFPAPRERSRAQRTRARSCRDTPSKWPTYIGTWSKCD